MPDRVPLHREVIEVPWNGKDSHERPVSPRKGPFDKKPRDPAQQQERDLWLEKQATQEADRLFELLKQHYAELKRHELGGSSVLDVFEAADQLWQHLRTTPVTLTRKARLVAALEPLRKQFTQEGWKERIEELRSQEQKIRNVYLRARAFKIHSDIGNRMRKNEQFDPMSAAELTETLSTLKDYLAHSSLEIPSKAARFMDKEIRALLPALKDLEGKEVTTRSILFTQTNEAFTKAQQTDHALRVLEKKRNSPDILQPQNILALKSASLQKEKMDTILQTRLKNELKSYDTPSMKAEARGVSHLLDRVSTDTTLYSLYKLSLKAAESSTPEEGLRALWDDYAHLRPGDRMVLTHLLDYHRKIFLPRRRMLLQQHQKYQESKEMPPSRARDEVEEEIRNISLSLEKPNLLDPETERADNEKIHRIWEESTLLKRRWQEQAENPATPRTTKEFQPLWEALQAQYTHTLKLLEQTGHISDNNEQLRLRTKDTLKNILTDIEHVEDHYVRALLSNSTARINRLDQQIWLFENAPGSKPNAPFFEKSVSQALEELKSTFQTIEEAYPSIARLEPFQKNLAKLGELFGRFYLAIQNSPSESPVSDAPSQAGPTWRPPSKDARNQTEEI